MAVYDPFKDLTLSEKLTSEALRAIRIRRRRHSVERAFTSCEVIHRRLVG
jgi:hypothetical protein